MTGQNSRKYSKILEVDLKKKQSLSKLVVSSPKNKYLKKTEKNSNSF